MRSVWNGTIVVGRVSVPVGLGIAASREGSGFKLLHRECGGPISQKRVCIACNVPLESNRDVVHGFEFATGQYAIFEQGELEAALAGTRIELDRFVSPHDIAAEYVDRTHWLAPAKDSYAEAAYAVLRTALDDLKLAGVGRIVLQRKELPCLVSTHPDERVLMLQTLFRPSEVRRPGEIWKRVAAVEISDTLLNLAREAVASRVYLSYKPGRLDAWFPPRLPAIIESRKDGGKVSVPEPDQAAPRDLEAALRKSLKRAKRPKAKA